MSKGYMKILVSVVLTMLIFSAMGSNAAADSEPEDDNEPYTFLSFMLCLLTCLLQADIHALLL